MGFRVFFHFDRDLCIVFAPPNFVRKSEGDVKMEILKNTMHYLSRPYRKVYIYFLPS